jgi:predicted RNase H-like nuclease (RuvC/YqgF family)
MTDKIEELKEEISRLEEEYERAQARSMFDKKTADRIYRKLKNKRKELKTLEEQS